MAVNVDSLPESTAEIVKSPGPIPSHCSNQCGALTVWHVEPQGMWCC